MAKGLVKDSTLTAIANAIREKTETSATMLPSEMAALIQGITGAKVEYGSKTLAVYQTVSNITINHGLNAIPNLVIIAGANNSGTSGGGANEQIVSFMILNTDTSASQCCVSASGDYITWETREFSAGESTMLFTTLNESKIVATRWFGDGFYGTYQWVAGVV